MVSKYRLQLISASWHFGIGKHVCFAFTIVTNWECRASSVGNAGLWDRMVFVQG